MAGIGHPILNDPLYGKIESRFELRGQALHAWRLAFRHPRTDEAMSFEAPPPRDYVQARLLVSTAHG
jgi:23S rRNA pseudouridine1911/1915/1917 synthase